jgi:SNF2 family DNA or RNA helicase
VTASLRSEIHQQEIILALKKELTYSTEAVKRHAIEREEQKLRELQQKLTDLEARVSTLTTQTCPICYDVPQNPALTPCCKNSFCLTCVCECISKTPACPLCRQKITSVSKLIVVGEEENTASKKSAGTEEPKIPTKGAALMKLLSESKPEDRFLVFSSHEASFKGLREILKTRGIKCEMLMGSGARVEKIRAQFREGKVRVLCMNARHIGAGINLENATHVVLYHRMNMELEKQVIGRAIRFERTAPLEVVHLVHDQETAMNGGSSSEVIVHL